jgi:hypothetical protein
LYYKNSENNGYTGGWTNAAQTNTTYLQELSQVHLSVAVEVHFTEDVMQLIFSDLLSDFLKIKELFVQYNIHNVIMTTYPSLVHFHAQCPEYQLVCDL